ncbi:MAG: hypothetical protein ACHQ4H_10605 [Ktedonobacterales bacterium]|jgi:hypothetical protein
MPHAYATGPAATTTTRPNPWALLFHFRKTFSLIGAVLHDARVHWLPKTIFLTCLGALLAAVLFPEVAADTLALIGIPGLGALFDALGLPIDASIDWAAFSVAAFNLLKLFPTDIVGEHYDSLFRSRRH